MMGRFKKIKTIISKRIKTNQKEKSVFLGNSISLSGIEVLHDEKARESNKMRFFEDFCEQSVDAGLDQFIYI